MQLCSKKISQKNSKHILEFLHVFIIGAEKMDYTVENLEKVVTMFYRTEANQQAEAHLWLTEAQNSPAAWSFVWELLSHHRSSEVQFFAATTLHTKLLKYWDEVPEDHYEFLKKRILEAIISYAMGPKIVLNRLCITLSAYIIHTIPNHWPKAFEELVSSFQPHHLPSVEPERVIWILLEILTVVPEEFQSSTLSVNKRNRVRTILRDVSKDILKVVEMCLMPLPATGFIMSNITTYLNASRCALSWIQLGGLDIENCSAVMNLLIDLTCFVYWNKSDPECLMGEEEELIEVTIEAITTIIQHPQTYKYKTLVKKYAEQILFKFEKILDAETNQQEMNKDILATLYALIVSIADCHSKIFIENMKSENQEEQIISFNLFNSIMKCTNLPGYYPVDEMSSILTFGFWYTLQDDIISLNTPDCGVLLIMIKPYYRELVNILLRKSMYPASEENWSLDDREVFRCYRQDIADTYIYCYVVLNIEMMDILNTKLNAALHKDSSNGSSQSIKWNEVETILHAFGAISESIESKNVYLPKLMRIIKEIPYEKFNVKVLDTALDTVGSYSEWLMEYPDALREIIPLLLSSLSNPEVALSSTMALKELTRSCQNFLIPFAEHILVASQAAIQSGALKLAECRRLMYSIGNVLSVLPVNKIMEYLNIILAPSYEELQKLTDDEPSQNIINSIVTKLRILGSLFSSLHVNTEEKVDQPILVVMQNTMSLYRQIGVKYSRNPEIIENLTTLFQYGVMTLKEECKPLINDILHIIITIFRDCPQANIFILAKTILILFGKDEEFLNINQHLLHEIVNTCLQMCANVSATADLSEKSDVLEAFFAMLANLFKKVPQLISRSGIDTAAIFQCAVLCLVIPEMQAIKAISSYLVQFIAQSRDTPHVTIVQTYGESLVLRLLLNLGNTAPRYSMDVFSDIFLILNKEYCDNLSRWLNTLLSQEGFPSPRITRQQKEVFVKAVLREKSNKQRLSETMLEFTLICKGILKPDEPPQ